MLLQRVGKTAIRAQIVVLQATGDLEEARRGHRRIREDEMEEKEREKATSDREDAREALDDDAIERRRCLKAFCRLGTPLARGAGDSGRVLRRHR